MKSDLPERQIIRPRFVGSLIAVFLILTMLLSSFPLTNLVYTIGVLLPFSWFLVRCFQTEQPDFAGLVSEKEARLIWVSSLILGLLAHRFIGTNASIAWFVSAGAFALYEPLLYNLLVVTGIIIPRDGNGYKGMD